MARATMVIMEAFGGRLYMGTAFITFIMMAGSTTTSPGAVLGGMAQRVDSMAAFEAGEALQVGAGMVGVAGIAEAGMVDDSPAVRSPVVWFGRD